MSATSIHPYGSPLPFFCAYPFCPAEVVCLVAVEGWWSGPAACSSEEHLARAIHVAESRHARGVDSDPIEEVLAR